jgi:lysophospholipase L1-like esterase
VTACPSAELAGFGAAWDDPSILADMVIFAEEEYMRIAVETDSDMIFMLEEFCGRGFNHDDPTAPCYRGPGTPRWFDLTCIHPNPDGHRAIADMFLAVVDE